MTAAHEPDREHGIHLSTEDLSDAAEAPESRTEAVDGHLQSCAECRAQVAAISQLLTMLAELPEPTVPPNVALRIDAALAREAQAGKHQAVAGTDPRRRAFRRQVRWWFGSLAAVTAGLALLFAVVLPGTNTGSSSSAASAMAAPNHLRSPSSPLHALALPPSATAGPELTAWAEAVLTAQTRGRMPVSPGDSGPTTSACLADPAFADRTLVAHGVGRFGSQPAFLVLYANGDDPSTRYAVAYALPCTASQLRVLDEGVVPR